MYGEVLAWLFRRILQLRLPLTVQLIHIGSVLHTCVECTCVEYRRASCTCMVAMTAMEGGVG